MRTSAAATIDLVPRMDRAELAAFLRRRREALQPHDVGLPAGPRRRTAGLRREEVAALAGMSADYYSRVEQQRGPQPSPQMLAALARGLRLTLDERDHLFRLAGQAAPTRVRRSDHVHPALLRVLDRLDDTPAQVTTDTAVTLAQNHLARALFGDQTAYAGAERSLFHRWFTQNAERAMYPARDHDLHSRAFVADLRRATTRHGPDSAAAELVRALRTASEEFAELWDRQEVAVRTTDRKVIVHPELGELDLDCQALHTGDASQVLVILTATPGTEDAGKLELLRVIGSLGASGP
jgi:transcriptional regulator with XRE-family HTH domain